MTDSVQSIIDEIEASEGLYCLSSAGPGGHQLGIKKTAQVVAALRASLSPSSAGSSPVTIDPRELLEKCAEIALIWKKECSEGDSEWHRGFRYAAENTSLQIAAAIRKMKDAFPAEAPLPSSAGTEDTTCYIERSKARETILARQPEDDLAELLRKIDALPIFNASDFTNPAQPSAGIATRRAPDAWQYRCKPPGTDKWSNWRPCEDPCDIEDIAKHGKLAGYDAEARPLYVDLAQPSAGSEDVAQKLQWQAEKIAELDDELQRLRSERGDVAQPSADITEEPYMPVMSMAVDKDHLHQITREQLANALDLIEQLRAPAQQAKDADVAQLNTDRAPAADEVTGDAGSSPVVGAQGSTDLPYVNFQYMGGNMDGGRHREEFAVIRASDWRKFVSSLSSTHVEALQKIADTDQYPDHEDTAAELREIARIALSSLDRK